MDIVNFPTLRKHLETGLQRLPKPLNEVLAKHGWLAYEILQEDVESTFWRDDDFRMLERCLEAVPGCDYASRLLSVDAVDSALAELLFAGGLSRRFPEQLTYESEVTERGRTPDLALRTDKVIFEVRALGQWGPAQGVDRVCNIVRSKLQAARELLDITLQLSEPVTIEDHHDVARSALDGIEEFKKNRGTVRFHIDLCSHDLTRTQKDPFSPHLTVRFRPGSRLSVDAWPTSGVQVTGAAASTFAEAENKKIGAVTVSHAGKTVVDHIRKLIRKKTNRQLLPGWKNFVVLIQRVGNEPIVPWKTTLRDALEGDSVLRLAVDGSEPPAEALLEATGAWSNGQNSRLFGAIGITIDMYGIVDEFFGYARAGEVLPPRVSDLLGISCDRGKRHRLPDLLAGSPPSK